MVIIPWLHPTAIVFMCAEEGREKRSCSKILLCTAMYVRERYTSEKFSRIKGASAAEGANTSKQPHFDATFRGTRPKRTAECCK